MAEYRPVPDDRLDDFREITRYAFSPTEGPFDPDAGMDERRERMFDFGERRGMFDGDDLLVVCKHLDFTARVRGEWLPMAGLSAVASPPEHRRQGLVGEMMAASLAEYRERGQRLSALYPFDEGFYARYGWATGCRYHRATVEPAALSVVADDATGAFRRVGPDEFDALEPVYEAWLDGVDLATRRRADWWRDRVFQSHDGELTAAVWERDGEPRGYLVYDVEDGDDGRRLKTYEVAYADHETYVNLLRYCYNHDSQVSEVELYGRDHGRILEVVTDRDAVELEVASGPMVRVVDVPAALGAIHYPGVDHEDLVLAVEDEHAPWNDGTVAVRVRDGEATVEETDEAPAATVGVGTLSQLYVGHLSVARARAVGDLSVTSGGAEATLERLFPEGQPFLPDGF